MTTIMWHDWAGYVGVLLVLLAFLLMQAHKLHGNGLTYQLMNIFGALGVMLSLVFGSFNAPAFVMEAAWAAIGVFGVLRGMRLRREKREFKDQPNP
jgi:paired small multidrug resistance pump